MSDVNAESALELHQSIIDRPGWFDRGMAPYAGYVILGCVALDSKPVDPRQLPASVLARLQATPTDCDGEYQVTFARRLGEKYPTLDDYFNTKMSAPGWQPGTPFADETDMYMDSGRNVGCVRIARACAEVLIYADYWTSTIDSDKPGQPPLCDVEVDVIDDTQRRNMQRQIGKMGGGILEVARAFGIDPMTGGPDPDLPQLHLDNVELIQDVAGQLGKPISHAQLKAMHQNAEVAKAMRTAEPELNPLTTEEVLAVAAFSRSIKTTEWSDL